MSSVFAIDKHIRFGIVDAALGLKLTFLLTSQRCIIAGGLRGWHDDNNNYYATSCYILQN